MKAHPEIGLHLRRAQGETGLLVLLWNGPERRIRHVDDGGQDHNGQHDHGGQQAGAGAEVEQVPDGRHQHDHAHQTVHHRRDARQQLYRRADHRRQLRRGHLRQKYSSQQSHRNADDDGPGSAVNRGQNKGQNSVLCAGGGVGGVPDLAQQKLKQANLPNGGQAGENEIDADEQHKGHRHDAAQQKNQMDDLLHGFAGTVAAPLRCMRGICNAFHRVDGGQNCVRVHVWLLSRFYRKRLHLR